MKVWSKLAKENEERERVLLRNEGMVPFHVSLEEMIKWNAVWLSPEGPAEKSSEFMMSAKNGVLITHNG